MGVSEILEFVKVEHTLFSLPFVLIGFVLADNEFGSEVMDVVWIIVAAVGARGLAMALNRIVDRDIDAQNPRTASRHLPSGTMTMRAAWILAASFLGMLLIAAWMLNEVALKMAWLPVLAFVIYPYTKRVSWICHFWIGLCLALAPAGAWVAIAADTHGWGSITGQVEGGSELLWYPEVFFISLGVALWISCFDINYALMDKEVDRSQGIRSFPARYGEEATMRLSVALTLGWLVCFLLTGIGGLENWVTTVVMIASINLYVVTKGASRASGSADDMTSFQSDLFRASMLTGWFLLGSLVFIVY
tara:strand:+ start:162 stop:1073 length:912 start_codon:yes stop_codon:yes gene_type:complete